MTRRAGRILIFAGVAVWLVYAISWISGADPSARAFLPFHLIGVIPGAILSQWEWIRGRVTRRS